MRAVWIGLAALLLTGCVGAPPRSSTTAVFDLGESGAQWSSPGFAITGVDVRSSAWLDGVAQLYRLAYVTPLQRQAYAQSRWAAPPAELVERQLRRRIVFGEPETGFGGCRLRLVLEEFEQRFDSPQSSLMILGVSASLLPRNGDRSLARRSFELKRAAPTPDALGGAVGARASVDALIEALSAWLVSLSREQPATLQSCKEIS